MLFVFVLTAALSAQDWRNGIPWKKPAVIIPGTNPGDPPSDAIILFDGKDTSAWNKEWAVENGELVCVPGKGDITTKQKFGSVQLHIEFAVPLQPSRKSQGSGNSGVFFGPYEVQILNSFENETYYDGMCASIYKQVPPIVNVCRKREEWQFFDIVFNRPELAVENDLVYVIRPAYVTVFHNGILVVNRHELLGSTAWHKPPVYEAHESMLPVRLQDHGDAVRFRNIWIRVIPDTNVRPEPTLPPYIE